MSTLLTSLLVIGILSCVGLAMFYIRKIINNQLTKLQYKYINDPILNPIPKHTAKFIPKYQTGWICMVQYYIHPNQTLPNKGHFHIHINTDLFAGIKTFEEHGWIFKSIKFTPVFA
jgi:hypothetical protein